MLASSNDLDARIPVWVALSELYLDTDVSMAYDFIVRTLAASPYSIDQLHEILRFEMHPALYHNLMHATGEWAGFDEPWLIARINAVRRQPRWRRQISHWLVPDIGPHWQTLEPMILSARNPAASA